MNKIIVNPYNIYDDEEMYFFPFPVPHVFTGNMSTEEGKRWKYAGYH
jgi:hypothetical protein